MGVMPRFHGTCSSLMVIFTWNDWRVDLGSAWRPRSGWRSSFPYPATLPWPIPNQAVKNIPRGGISHSHIAKSPFTIGKSSMIFIHFREACELARSKIIDPTLDFLRSSGKISRKIISISMAVAIHSWWFFSPASRDKKRQSRRTRGDIFLSHCSRDSSVSHESPDRTRGPPGPSAVMAPLVYPVG